MTPLAHAPGSLLSDRVREVGLALGFDLVGFARALPGPETAYLHEWLGRGFAGEMHYIGRRAEERVDPRKVLPGCRSVIAVALRYDDAPASSGASSGAGRVSSHAAGDDYHELIGDRLRAFEAALPSVAGGPVSSRGYVDTGPVLERVWARLAGIGWIGKNTCLIHPQLGSRLFLGAILTDLDLVPDERSPDHCGSCRACLDACPTDAFAEPYVLDASRCLSYTTIELRGAIPVELRERQGDWVYGCDVCQEVCPFESKAGRGQRADPLGLRERLSPRDVWDAPTLAWLLDLDEAAWRTHTRRSAMRRARFQGLLRNALVAAGNSGEASLVPRVRRHAEGEDPLLADHARWALQRLTGSGA